MRSLFRLLLILQLSALAAPQAANAPTWHVRLADGTDTKLSVVANADAIEFRMGHTVELTVPARSITGIIHGTQLVRRSTKAYNSAENMCCGGTDSHLTSFLALAIAAPLGSARTHYVEIRWHQNTDRTVVVELGKNEYRPFMDWLEQLSGTKWRDIALEREQAVNNMQQHAGSAWQVDIRSPQNSNYGIRHYSLAPLDDNDETQLYLFEGAVKPQNLVAILPATRVWSMNRCVHDTNVLYGECRNDSCDIAAIMLPTSTYYVLPRKDSIGRDPAADHDGSCDELQKQEAEWQREELEKHKDNPVLRRSRPPQPEPEK
jgi:hypothetical protein